jgi:hypothetical protein
MATHALVGEPVGLGCAELELSLSSQAGTAMDTPDNNGDVEHNATDANWFLAIEDVEHLLIEAPVAPEDISAPPLINVVEQGHSVADSSTQGNDFEGNLLDLRWQEEGPQHVPNESVTYHKLGLAVEDEREIKRERMLAIVDVMEII